MKDDDKKGNMSNKEVWEKKISHAAARLEEAEAMKSEIETSKEYKIVDRIGKFEKKLSTFSNLMDRCKVQVSNFLPEKDSIFLKHEVIEHYMCVASSLAKLRSEISGLANTQREVHNIQKRLADRLDELMDRMDSKE